MTGKIDGRRVRGDRTRERTATAAAEMATLTGLDSISVSKLAKATGGSASGILTVFENREAIQLAAVNRARDLFVAEVITPAWSTKPGVDRLSHILENWFEYVERRVFPGGCFLVATSVEYGAQDGPVADEVRRLKQTWITLIEGELRVGRRKSKRTDELVEATAFKLDAYLTAANIRLQLAADPGGMAIARKACRELLRDLP